MPLPPLKSPPDKGLLQTFRFFLGQNPSTTSYSSFFLPAVNLNPLHSPEPPGEAAGARSKGRRSLQCQGEVTVGWYPKKKNTEMLRGSVPSSALEVVTAPMSSGCLLCPQVLLLSSLGSQKIWGFCEKFGGPAKNLRMGALGRKGGGHDAAPGIWWVVQETSRYPLLLRETGPSCPALCQDCTGRIPAGAQTPRGEQLLALWWFFWEQPQEQGAHDASWDPTAVRRARGSSRVSPGLSQCPCKKKKKKSVALARLAAPRIYFLYFSLSIYI